METQVVEMTGRRFWTWMRINEFEFKRRSYQCARLEVSRKAGVSEPEVRSLSSAKNRVT